MLIRENVIWKDIHQEKTGEGWEHSSVVQCLPGMCKALGLIPSTVKKFKLKKLDLQDTLPHQFS
jgi:hypothetical protein